ncbi:hypothetical protein COV19_06015 [Candidatus Woesearchaeota archaeon CG10_big_fil_rev_8_21_14_0_10_44_13]|nr:MAG: hypothetical protein COV19_06015 [Candidatus Woesearchaeota archaeon CG10_big_fil_rev_8_21_14_0_10_44_13]
MDEKPIFVKIDAYEDIRDIINIVKKKISEARGTLDRIHQLCHEEESELEAWQNEVEDVEKRVSTIDKSLFA